MSGPLLSLINGLVSGDLALILSASITLVLLLGVAFPFHELAHAVAARHLGDDTSEHLGRITLNPLAHLDPFGTLLFVLTGFGWAKPVPVNPYRLRGDPRWSFALVALAGPASNLLLAVLFALFFRVLNVIAEPAALLGNILRLSLLVAVQLNLLLALFNLIPVPPLDGSRLLAALLPEQGQMWMDQLERYGFLILFALAATGLLGQLISAPAMLLGRTMLGL
ncbi:MAG: site-2 protease family protein [Chloroflexi bacterium]|jgi:Zn-dependent proteases|nr:site-2 protease family protein [Chloroflexota bacterium]